MPKGLFDIKLVGANITGILCAQDGGHYLTFCYDANYPYGHITATAIYCYRHINLLLFNDAIFWHRFASAFILAPLLSNRISVIHGSRINYETICCPQFCTYNDTKFGNSRCEIVGRRVIFIWSLIHGLRWSGLIKAEPGNGMLSDDTKPLLGPMLISHQWCLVTLTWGQFQRKRRRYSWKEFENYSFEITAAHDPEANKLTQLDWRSSTGVFHLLFRKPWCRDKMAANLQRTFSQCIFLNENIWISIKISLKIVPKCPINNILLFILWLGSDQATSHYLDQWWYVYWRIYASLGLIMDSHIYIYFQSNCVDGLICAIFRLATQYHNIIQYPP